MAARVTAERLARLAARDKLSRGSFVGHLLVGVPKFGDTRIVHEPLGYISLDGWWRLVEENFETDYCSMIWPLRWIWPPSGRYTYAAVLHDHLYRHPCGLSRKECDRLYLEACWVLGVWGPTRYPMYFGLRIGGWVVWNRYRRADAQDQS